jgi:hypothetical protein
MNAPIPENNTSDAGADPIVAKIDEIIQSLNDLKALASGEENAEPGAAPAGGNPTGKFTTQKSNPGSMKSMLGM